jgi:hypothetical protein
MDRREHSGELQIVPKVRPSWFKLRWNTDRRSKQRISVGAQNQNGARRWVEKAARQASGDLFAMLIHAVLEKAHILALAACVWRSTGWNENRDAKKAERKREKEKKRKRKEKKTCGHFVKPARIK